MVFPGSEPLARARVRKPSLLGELILPEPQRVAKGLLEQALAPKCDASEAGEAEENVARPDWFRNPDDSSLRWRMHDLPRVGSPAEIVDSTGRPGVYPHPRPFSADPILLAFPGCPGRISPPGREKRRDVGRCLRRRGDCPGPPSVSNGRLGLPHPSRSSAGKEAVHFGGQEPLSMELWSALPLRTSVHFCGIRGPEAFLT